MDIQSLLFSRADGWTEGKAKEWAKAHGYKHGKVHVTDQYVRIRQFDPKGLKVKRTITLGRGIRAVVARKEDMAAKRRKKKSAAPAAPKRRRAAKRRRAREVPAAAEARRPRRRKARRTREVAEAKRPRRRKARRVAARRRAPASGQMMEARRKPRRRRARAQEAWHGDSAGHRKAAKKGAARRRRRAAPKRRRARETTMTESRRPRRRKARRRAREFAYESPRRRPRRAKRRRSRAREQVMEARRPRRSSRRRRSYVHARGGGSNRGMYVAEMAIAIATAGLGFILADGLDRFLATYDPSSTAAKPTDKFTSDGAGTLANTLNVAATPSLYRIGAAIGMTVIPAVGSAYVDQPFVRSGLEGMAIGAGVNAFKLLWQNVVMPLLAPKDTSTAGLQKSFIARLYPAEIAAKINLDAKQTAVSSPGAGALSGPPAPGVGASPADVGPFALAGDPAYPDAHQALRQQTGVRGSSEYADAAQALRQRAGLQDEMYASAADALRRQAGVSQPPGYQPGPPPGPGPGPQAAPHSDPSCGCIGDDNPFLGFIGDAEEEPMFQTSGKAAA